MAQSEWANCGNDFRFQERFAQWCKDLCLSTFASSRSVAKLKALCVEPSSSPSWREFTALHDAFVARLTPFTPAAIKFCTEAPFAAVR